MTLINSKRKVLIDLDRLKDINTGLGQVAVNIGKALSNINVPDIEFTLLVPNKFVGFFGNTVKYEAISLRRRYLPTLCAKYDLWYTIHQDCSYFPGNSSTPFVMTINDMNFLGEKSPSKATRRLRALQKVVNRTDHLTTISHYSASIIRLHLKTGNIPLDVIYDGVEVLEFPGTVKPAYVPEGRILFNVGVVREKKNLMVLLPFLKYIPEDFVLVIAGNKKSHYAIEIEQKVKELGLEKRVVLPGLISDNDKYWLFSNSEAILFPSKFEGMGFPPIEAMRFGKPVFVSTCCSIPEVCGDKAFYWDNFDPLVMAEVFNTKMKEFESVPDMACQLKQHSLKYTWQNATQQYIELFRRVMESHNSQ